MTKYKETFLKMIEEHKDLFDRFRPVHQKYSQNMQQHQVEFNQIGAEIMETVRDWEDRLCGRSEGSGYASFTANLAEKFMEEVRKEFPMIDRVGIIMSSPAKAKPTFELNKISPSEEGFNLRKLDI